ncbi:MAG: hypothetical protein Q4C40_07185 [Eubacteriales bacterium]|nr:hypothetical protein [Eubacteriales bacterium]
MSEMIRESIEIKGASENNLKHINVNIPKEKAGVSGSGKSSLAFGTIAADWIIDMGPEGGHQGGEIIFTGTPEQLISCKESVTGQYLLKNVK